MGNTAVVVTTIHAPNAMMTALAVGCRERGASFIVTGDEPTPPDYGIPDCDYYGLDRQSELRFETARVCPTRSVARKNIAYLLAMDSGARRILETDDDNFPFPDFWDERPVQHRGPAVADAGWVNAYGYFTDELIWPRGYPLEAIRQPSPPWEQLESRTVTCPVHAGLADTDPDVDAIYRLTRPLPRNFRRDRRVALLSGAWCPFNSQNTTWWPEAHALLYLPSTCTFRVADIWRSFIAQRVLWTNGWGVLHHEPTVWQERSPHDLLRDFESEIPGYLHNASIAKLLAGLDLPPGGDHIGDNLRTCYEALVRNGLLRVEELGLVSAWLADVRALGVG